MGILETSLIVATFFCSLVAGFVFAFAVVVMPGIKHLKDAEFIRAFQVMDRIIQNNQPLFILVWVGSALALIVAAGLGIAELTGGTPDQIPMRGVVRRVQSGSSRCPVRGLAPSAFSIDRPLDRGRAPVALDAPW